MAFTTGKTGYATRDGNLLPFGKWKSSAKNNKVKTPTWFSPNNVFWQVGQDDATVTLEGPYNAGAVGFSLGLLYTVVLVVSAGVTNTVIGFVESIDVEDDVEGQPMATVTIQQQQNINTPAIPSFGKNLA